MQDNLSKRNHVVRDICAALDYKGRTIRLGNTYGRSVLTLDGTYWDGGRKTYWHAFDVQSGALKPVPVSDAPAIYGGREGDTVDLARLPEGIIVIAEEHVSGRVALRLYPSQTPTNYGGHSPLGSRAQLALGAAS